MDSMIAARVRFTAIISNVREVNETVAWMPAGETLDAFRARVDASIDRVFDELKQADYPKPQEQEQPR